jgi:hypothetical protein
MEEANRVNGTGLPQARCQNWTPRIDFLRKFGDVPGRGRDAGRRERDAN